MPIIARSAMASTWSIRETYSYDLRQFPHGAKDRFVNSVLNGKNGRMPPWRDMIGADEIDAIWAYVLTGGHI